MTPYGCNTCLGDKPSVQPAKSNLQFLLLLICCILRAFVWSILALMRYLLPSFFIALLLACGNPSPNAPLKGVMVLVPNADGIFEPQKQQLTTVSDISKLEGSVTTLIGGARMIWDDNDPKLQAATTIEEARKALFKKEGGSVRAQFIEKNGVLWPADFHSWAMVTAYWNLEQSFLYFQEIYGDRPTKELLKVPTYYWLDTNILEPQKKESNTDNAIFHGAFRMMAVLPFKDFQTIPMSINLGVMAHEYAHFVFDARVHHANPMSPTHVDPEHEASLIQNGLNEGLADFHAYGITRRLDGQGNVRFLEWTLDEGEANRRDFADPTKCFYPADRYNIYAIGTAYAASFYHAARDLGELDNMAKFLINAYDSDAPGKPIGLRQYFLENSETPDNISLASVANIFLPHITNNELRRRTCNELLDRFGWSREEMLKFLPNCPSTSASHNKCRR